MLLMVRRTSVYVCQQCGNEETKWFGKCPNCGEWGSLVETAISGKTKAGGRKTEGKAGKPIKLSSATIKSTKRISTKIPELDRVLGGGLVPGQVVLLAGEPGIGKSTLLLQIADKLGSFLYVSGEESLSQIKLRADRLKVKRKTIEVLEEVNVDEIIETIYSLTGEALRGVAIDSIQTMMVGNLTGMAGSVGQVRESSYRLSRVAKELGIPLIIVGQVTKQGSVAGPATLMHLVDTVLWFEGEQDLTLRLLRVNKNRFGSTDEVGVFEMTDTGLNSMSNPEKLFLTKRRKLSSGSSVSLMMQGTRPILIEIQSLVVPTKLAYPKRIAQGIDSRRLELLLAVLTKACGLPFYGFDCFVNVAGGITVKEPAVDLAICLSILSSYFDTPLPKGTLSIGEVGLLGDIREVVAQDKRLKDAKRLGFSNTINSRTHSHLQRVQKEFFGFKKRRK